MFKPPCKNCDDTGWVCENHADQPWGDLSDRADACKCGAGAPCDVCNPRGETERAIVTVVASVDGKSDLN